MWISLENIRNMVITADEWVELTNILFQFSEMTAEEKATMPDFTQWVEEVIEILKQENEKKLKGRLNSEMAQ